jgi:hypothetical protein
MFLCCLNNPQINQVVTWFGMIFETDRQTDRQTKL